jgi:hypothetical protein
VLFLVGKITDSNKSIYDAFCSHVGKHFHVDIITYQYKSQQFQEIINLQLGNYHYYVVMPHLIEAEDSILTCLNKISGDRLLLMDQNFEQIRHTHASLVCEPAKQIVQIFNTQLNLFNKYRAFNLVLTEEDYFDPQWINGCREFCESISMDFQVLDGLEQEDIRLGEIYFTLADMELAKAIHYADKLELRLGKDIGVLAHNDSCLKDILAGGITVLSSQPDQMGTIAAQMLLDHDKTSKKIELKLIVRKSL